MPVLLLTGFHAANSLQADEATASAPVLTLKSRTVFDEGQTSPREYAVYTAPIGTDMMTFAARSADNGTTWVPFRSTPDFDTGLRKGFRRSVHPAFVDPVNKQVLTLVLALDVPDLDPGIVEPPIGENEYYLRYRVSTDGGRTYLFDEPIIQQGDYSQRHPVDDVWLGKNGYYLGDVGCIPIRTREGRILVPAQVPLLGEDGNLAMPGGGFTYQYTRMLIGTWQPDQRIHWEVSQKIEGDPDRTSRGLFEPTLAELPDGRLICIMRGSNGGTRDPECQWEAGKWFSTSQDGGRTWTKAELWRHSDGTPLYSPSAMSQLMTLTDGRIFWIGNASEQNCCANNPRHPLIIGQVDPESAGLIKNTKLLIDTLQNDDAEGLNLSHWMAYEDRVTHELHIGMRRWNTPYTKFHGAEYTIEVGPCPQVRPRPQVRP